MNLRKMSILITSGRQEIQQRNMGYCINQEMNSVGKKLCWVGNPNKSKLLAEKREGESFVKELSTKVGSQFFENE